MHFLCHSAQHMCCVMWFLCLLLCVVFMVHSVICLLGRTVLWCVHRTLVATRVCDVLNDRCVGRCIPQYGCTRIVIQMSHCTPHMSQIRLLHLMMFDRESNFSRQNNTSTMPLSTTPSTPRTRIALQHRCTVGCYLNHCLPIVVQQHQC